MADTTRDSYQHDKNYVEVVIQRGKIVLDAELNEMQRIAQARLHLAMRAILGDSVYSEDDGGRVTSDGATANQLTVKAGVVVVDGHVVNIDADILVTGLSTPGSARSDDVYIQLDSVEIDSVEDESIAAQAIGETSLRRQLQVSIVVDQGAASPPSSTSDGVTYLGGRKYALLARVYRAAATAIIDPAWCVDQRAGNLQKLLLQDRNLTFSGTNITWDGTTLSIGTLTVALPDSTAVYNLTALSVTLTSGQAAGWIGSSPANTLRRRFNSVDIDNGATADSNTDVLTTVASLQSLSAGARGNGILVLAVCVGSTLILRDGTCLLPGDTALYWGRSNGLRSPATTNYAPLLIGRDPYTSAPRSTVDHLGYRLGQVQEWDESWRTTGTTDPAGWAFAGAGARSYNDPTADLPYRNVNINSGTATNAGILTSVPIGYVGADQTFVAEWEVRTGSVGSGATAIQHKFIVKFSHAAAWDYYVGLSALPSTANWTAEVITGSTSQTSTGVAVAANTTYRMRIEIIGDNNQSGSGFLIRWFINGTLVHSLTTSALSADVIRLEASVTNPAAGPASYAVDLSPIKCRWNNRLTPDTL